MNRKDEIKILLTHLSAEAVRLSVYFKPGGIGVLMPRMGDHIMALGTVLKTMKQLREEWKAIRD